MEIFGENSSLGKQAAETETGSQQPVVHFDDGEGYNVFEALAETDSKGVPLPGKLLGHFRNLDELQQYLQNPVSHFEFIEKGEEQISPESVFEIPREDDLNTGPSADERANNTTPPTARDRQPGDFGTGNRPQLTHPDDGVDRGAFWRGLFNALTPKLSLDPVDIAMRSNPIIPVDNLKTGFILWLDLFNYSTSDEGSDQETDAALNLLRRIPMVQWHEGTERLARLYYRDKPLTTEEDARELLGALGESVQGGAGTATMVTTGGQALSTVRLGGPYSGLANLSRTERDHMPPMDSFVQARLLPAGRLNAMLFRFRSYLAAARIDKSKHRKHSTTGSSAAAQQKRREIAKMLHKGEYEKAFDTHAREYLKNYPNDKKLHKAIEQARQHFLDNVVPILKNILRQPMDD